LWCKPENRRKFLTIQRGKTSTSTWSRKMCIAVLPAMPCSSGFAPVHCAWQCMVGQVPRLPLLATDCFTALPTIQRGDSLDCYATPCLPCFYLLSLVVGQEPRIHMTAADLLTVSREYNHISHPSYLSSFPCIVWPSPPSAGCRMEVLADFPQALGLPGLPAFFYTPG
jgi:hypothetical protein